MLVISGYGRELTWRVFESTHNACVSFGWKKLHESFSLIRDCSLQKSLSFVAIEGFSNNVCSAQCVVMSPYCYLSGSVLISPHGAGVGALCE